MLLQPSAKRNFTDLIMNIIWKLSLVKPVPFASSSMHTSIIWVQSFKPSKTYWGWPIIKQIKKEILSYWLSGKRCCPCLRQAKLICLVYEWSFQEQRMNRMDHFFASVSSLMSNLLRSCVENSIHDFVDIMENYLEGNDYEGDYNIMKDLGLPSKLVPIQFFLVRSHYSTFRCVSQLLHWKTFDYEEAHLTLSGTLR